MYYSSNSNYSTIYQSFFPSFSWRTRIAARRPFKESSFMLSEVLSQQCVNPIFDYRVAIHFKINYFIFSKREDEIIYIVSPTRGKDTDGFYGADNGIYNPLHMKSDLQNNNQVFKFIFSIFFQCRMPTFIKKLLEVIPVRVFQTWFLGHLSPVEPIEVSSFCNQIVVWNVSWEK